MSPRAGSDLYQGEGGEGGECGEGGEVVEGSGRTFYVRSEHLENRLILDI